MDVEAEIKQIIDNAPKYGVPTLVMEQAVVPVLKLFAKNLQHQEYQVIQTLDGDWVLTTLESREQPEKQTTVVYAFATLKDAATFPGAKDPKLMAMPLSAIQVLFQLFAIDRLDSIIFLETPGDLSTGKQIDRADLQNSIQGRLQQLETENNPKSDNIPPNFA